VKIFRKNLENRARNEKPPAALAGGGLGAAVLHNSFGQAWFPARALEPLIRRAGIGTAMHGAEEQIVFAPEECMTFIEVEQRSKKRVKEAGSG
jgi:hypothetical protein